MPPGAPRGDRQSYRRDYGRDQQDSMCPSHTLPVLFKHTLPVLLKFRHCHTRGTCQKQQDRTNPSHTLPGPSSTPSSAAAQQPVLTLVLPRRSSGSYTGIHTAVAASVHRERCAVLAPPPAQCLNRLYHQSNAKTASAATTSPIHALPPLHRLFRLPCSPGSHHWQRRPAADLMVLVHPSEGRPVPLGAQPSTSGRGGVAGRILRSRIKIA